MADTFIPLLIRRKSRRNGRRSRRNWPWNLGTPAATIRARVAQRHPLAGPAAGPLHHRHEKNAQGHDPRANPGVSTAKITRRPARSSRRRDGSPIARWSRRRALRGNFIWGRAAVSFSPPPPKPGRPSACAPKKPNKRKSLLGCGPCFRRHHERRFALRLLNAVLGENMNSRLFQTVRKDQGVGLIPFTAATTIFVRHGRPGDLGGPGFGEFGQNLEDHRRELRRLRGRNRRLPPNRAGARLPKRPVGFEFGKHISDMMWGVGEQWLGYGKIVAPESLKRALEPGAARRRCARRRGKSHPVEQSTWPWSGR